MHVDHVSSVVRFLSSNAQDFIEEATGRSMMARRMSFLSSNAQDFIEDATSSNGAARRSVFLSSNAQDFIEDWRRPARTPRNISNS